MKKTQNPKNKVAKLESEDENICSPSIRSDKSTNIKET